MSARLYGNVYDAATGSMIATAIVTDPPYNVTNNNGAYSIFYGNGVVTDVTASAPNYSPQTIRVTVGNGTAKQQDFHLTHL